MHEDRSRDPSPGKAPNVQEHQSATSPNRTNVIGEGLSVTLKEHCPRFRRFLLASDGSTDVVDVVRLANVMRGVKDDFTAVEESLNVTPMEERTSLEQTSCHKEKVIEAHSLTE